MEKQCHERLLRLPAQNKAVLFPRYFQAMCSPLGLNSKEHLQGPAALGEAQHSCCPVPTQPKWSFPVRAAQQTPVAISGFLDNERGEVHPAAKSRRAASGDCGPGDSEMWLHVLLRQRTPMGYGSFLHLVLHSVCPHSNECMSNKQSVSNCCEGPRWPHRALQTWGTPRGEGWLCCRGAWAAIPGHDQQPQGSP